MRGQTEYGSPVGVSDSRSRDQRNCRVTFSEATEFEIEARFTAHSFVEGENLTRMIIARAALHSLRTVWRPAWICLRRCGMRSASVGPVAVRVSVSSLLMVVTSDRRNRSVAGLTRLLNILLAMSHCRRSGQCVSDLSNDAARERCASPRPPA